MPDTTDNTIDFSVDSTSEDPFAGVDFTRPMPSMNLDNTVQLLNAFDPRRTPVQTMTESNSTPISKALDMKAGAARVNANTGKTGAVAIIGADGKVTLTNRAIDATGREAPIGGGNPPGDYQAATATSIPVANNVYNALNQLKGATDIESARGIFSNLQESLVKESNKLENDASLFALNKIGVPKMEAMLAQSEIADRSDPMWYAGIGDSPITAKLRTEVGMARGYADQESKRYLDNNLGYKMLRNNAAQADAEMKRVSNIATRKEALADSISLRRADKDEAKQADLENKSQVISVDQLQRIGILLPGELPTENDGTNAKIKALQLYTGNKSKDFRAAIDAPGDKLPEMALMGNSFAETLVIRQEATNTGIPESQIKAQLKAAREWMANPQNITKGIMQMSGPELEGKKNVASHVIALNSSDVGEKNKATATKAQVALWYMDRKKNELFNNDVTSWNSVDPALITAATDAAKKNGGRKDLESVLTAYVGDAVGPEAHKKYGDFIRLIDAAGEKSQGSITGRIDTMEARAKVIRASLGANMFRKWMASIGKAVQPIADMPIAEIASAIPGSMAALGDTLQAGRAAYNSEFAKSVRLMTGLGEQPKAPIDPLTLKPIGER